MQRWIEGLFCPLQRELKDTDFWPGVKEGHPLSLTALHPLITLSIVYTCVFVSTLGDKWGRMSVADGSDDALTAFGVNVSRRWLSPVTETAVSSSEPAQKLENAYGKDILEFFQLRKPKEKLCPTLEPKLIPYFTPYVM